MIEGMAAAVPRNLRSDAFEVDSTFRIDPYAMVYGIVGEKGGKAREVNMEPGDKFTAEDYRRMEEGYLASMMSQLEQLAGQDQPFYLQYWPMYPLKFTRSDIEQAKTLNGGPIPEALVEVDEWIGQIMDKIDELGIAENTLVVAMADNGPMVHSPPPQFGMLSLMYRGGKGDFLEGGVRVPAFASWPGMIDKGQMVGDIVHVTDLYATFARLAGATRHIPTDRVIDGIDQTALLLSGDTHSRRDYVCRH